MSQLPQEPAPAPSPGEPRRAVHPTAGDPWSSAMLGAAGGLVIAYGIYRLATTSPPSPLIGPGAIGLGLTLMPWRIVALVGAVGLVLLGGYRLIDGYGVQAGLVLVLGLLGIAERIRRN